MAISINFDVVKSGWSIVYIEWSHLLFLNVIEFLSQKNDIVLANSTDLVESCVLQHFIWVFTVCQSTCLEVSSLQKVKMTNLFSEEKYEYIIETCC